MLTPSDSDRGVLWYGENPAVASVDVNGVITANSAGTTILTAATADNGIAAQRTVTVESCAGSVYADMPAYGNWAHAGIDYIVDSGLFAGVFQSEFAPKLTMTRAMLVTLLWRFEGKPGGYTNIFSDVANGKWYIGAIAWAAAEIRGITYKKCAKRGLTAPFSRCYR